MVMTTTGPSPFPRGRADRVCSSAAQGRQLFSPAARCWRRRKEVYESPSGLADQRIRKLCFSTSPSASDFAVTYFPVSASCRIDRGRVAVDELRDQRRSERQPGPGGAWISQLEYPHGAPAGGRHGRRRRRPAHKPMRGHGAGEGGWLRARQPHAHSRAPG